MVVFMTATGDVKNDVFLGVTGGTGVGVVVVVVVVVAGVIRLPSASSKTTCFLPQSHVSGK